MMVTLIRISKNEVKFIPDSPDELKKVMEILTFFIEGAVFSPDFKSGHWNGQKKFYRNVNEICFGLSKYLIDRLAEEKIKYELKDFEKFSTKIDISKIELSTSLRPQQIEATKSFFKNPFGIVKIPTRGGKTFTAAECIRIARLFGYQKSIFFVDGIDLFNQTIEEFSNFFKIPKTDIGQLHGGEAFDFKDINVAMIQTFTSIIYPSDKRKYDKEVKKRKNEMIKIIQEIPFLIIDEVQEYTSDKRLGVIRKFKKVDLMLSLSATPFRSEDLIGNLKLREVVGDIIHEVSELELIDNGSLVKNYVLVIIFTSDMKVGDNFSHYIEENIVNDDKRNFLIINILRILQKLKLKSLFLINRKNHGKLLSDKTGITYVSGDNNSDDRQKIKTEFLDTESGILFASDIYKKGVSLNNCEVLVNVSGGLEKSSIIQKRGRVLASTEGKNTALIIDIFDHKEYFRIHSLSRLDAYEEIVGKNNIMVLDSSDNDFIEDLELIIEGIFNG